MQVGRNREIDKLYPTLCKYGITEVKNGQILPYGLGNQMEIFEGTDRSKPCERGEG